MDAFLFPDGFGLYINSRMGGLTGCALSVENLVSESKVLCEESERAREIPGFVAMEFQGRMSELFDEPQDLLQYHQQHQIHPLAPQPHIETAADVPMILQNDDMERSGSENQLEGDSTDEQEAQPNQAQKRKRYHRHNQHQIAAMEEYFKKCPHPDDKARRELSLRLGLEPLQVKFWFQNKRTQTKTQNERNVNQQLRAENEKLREENLRFKEALGTSSCPSCGGPSIGEMSFEGQQLRLENSRLREQIDRLSGIAARHAGSSLVPSTPMLSPVVPSCGPSNRGHGIDAHMEPAAAIDFGLLGVGDVGRNITELTESNKTMIVELAIAAMEEFLSVVQMGEPLWLPSVDDSMEVLIEEEYVQTFQGGVAAKVFGVKTEATRASVVVYMNPSALVEILLEVNEWATFFSEIISRTMSMNVLSNGAPHTRNGALQVIKAEYQLPSPLVPIRESTFLRYCKQQAENTWAIVDVSVDDLRSNAAINCRRRPSGCLIQEIPDGLLKVTWVEHVEADDSVVHELYKPLVTSGVAFGAKRWAAALYRQSDRITSAMELNITNDDANTRGKNNILRLGERMVNGFYAAVTGSTFFGWTTLSAAGETDVKITKKTIKNVNRASRLILNASTSIWLSVPPKRIFDFLRCETSRSEWDILSNGGAAEELAQVATGREIGNFVSLLSLNAGDSSASGKNDIMIIQECGFDVTGSYVVYSPVDASDMTMLLNGSGHPDHVMLLPSGFAIVPDGPGTSGSLLTISFQILVNPDSHSKISGTSISTVNGMISSTIGMIKNALLHDNVQ